MLTTRLPSMTAMLVWLPGVTLLLGVVSVAVSEPVPGTVSAVVNTWAP